MPCAQREPERGSTSPAWPAGISTAIPVPIAARSPGPIERRLGGVQVEARVALVRARRQRRPGLEQADPELHAPQPARAPLTE